MAAESERFARMARANLDKRFGKAALAVLAPQVVDQLLLAEAALIVLAQAMDQYAPAQALIRACRVEAR
jgi:hypothetical protein